jgi:hypothetical protein
METELAAAGISSAAVFVDDLLLWSDTIDEHITQLDKLLQHFIIKVDLRAHPVKTVVAAQTRIGYLGHLISAADTCQPEEAN